MSSIRDTADRTRPAYSPLSPSRGEPEQGAGELSLGDLFCARPESGQAARGFPNAYDAKGSLQAAHQRANAARLGLGVSALLGGAALWGHAGPRGAFLRGVCGLGFAASVAAMWSAGRLAAQCLAGANKALALALQAGCGVAYAGWPREEMNRQGIRANQQGSVPTVVATNETGLVGSTRVLVEQCPRSRMTVVAMAHSCDKAAASAVAQSVVRGTQEAVAALSRPDDPFQVRAAIKHAMQMPQRTCAPGYVDMLDLIADDAVVEATAIVMHADGPVAIGHIGRARALLCENGSVRPLTVKHTLDDTRERDRVRPEIEPGISRVSNLSRGLVKHKPGHTPTRAQVSFVPSARHADAVIVLLSPNLADKLNDAEVAERFKGASFDGPEARALASDLVSLARERGGEGGLAVAVAPCGPGRTIDYSKVVPRPRGAGQSQSRSEFPRRPPPMLGRRTRDPLQQPLMPE